MKLVINRCIGGSFRLPSKFCERYGLDTHDDIDRTDERLISYVEENGGEVEREDSFLHVVEIPDNATDWKLDDYCGIEEITYVVDGKIYYAPN